MNFPFARAGRDDRVDILRGAALLLIFVDHCSGNVFAYLSLRTLQFSDASELFFLLSGYSCMAAYGRRLDCGDLKGAASSIVRRCLRIYVAQILILLTAEALVWAWGGGEPLQLGHLHGLAASVEPRLGIASSGLFRAKTWGTVLDMATLTGEPAFFDILPAYIVLMAFFPLMWLGLRRSPLWTFAISGVIWIASHGQHGLYFTDLMQRLPWTFNPFGWQFIFLCGAGLRVILETRRNLPVPRALLALSLCLVAAALAFKLCLSFGLEMPRLILLSKENLSPIRLINALALVTLALSGDWPQRFLALPVTRALRVFGRHSLLVFSLGSVVALNVDLIFIRFGQQLPVQILATLGSAALLMTVAWLAEEHCRRTRQGRAVA